jgi:chromosome segregation ATPase
MLGELEHAAKQHTDEALHTRQQLKEREREAEGLRHQLAELGEKLSAFERQHPPSADAERLERELQQTRGRVAELEAELGRRDANVERAAAAAAHERARAERLVAEERRALADRNEARARAAEAEARAAAVAVDNERLRAAVEAEAERAHKAENEVQAKKERVKQLKRDLEDAERRLATAAGRAALVESVEERLGAVEAALRGEAERMGAMEAALRRAAVEAAEPPPPEPVPE